MVPVMSAYLLSLIPVYTPIEGNDKAWFVSHLYNYSWAFIIFGVLVFAFLWWLWGDTKKKDDHDA